MQACYSSRHAATLLCWRKVQQTTAAAAAVTTGCETNARSLVYYCAYILCIGRLAYTDELLPADQPKKFSAPLNVMHSSRGDLYRAIVDRLQIFFVVRVCPLGPEFVLYGM